MGRDYKEEYARYHSKPLQKKHRAERNAARRVMTEKGLVRKGDGMDVDHRRPLDSGGTNAVSNLRVETKAKNRGYARDSRNQPK